MSKCIFFVDVEWQWILEQAASTRQSTISVGQSVDVHQVATILWQHGQYLSSFSFVVNAGCMFSVLQSSWCINRLFLLCYKNRVIIRRFHYGWDCRPLLENNTNNTRYALVWLVGMEYNGELAIRLSVSTSSFSEAHRRIVDLMPSSVKSCPAPSLLIQSLLCLATSAHVILGLSTNLASS